MHNIKRQPVRCLAGRWMFLHADEWIEVNSRVQAELMAAAEPSCYAVINRQISGLPVASFLELAGQAWLEHFRGQPSRISRLCMGLADLLREKAAEEAAA